MSLVAKIKYHHLLKKYFDRVKEYLDDGFYIVHQNKIVKTKRSLSNFYKVFRVKSNKHIECPYNKGRMFVTNYKYGLLTNDKAFYFIHNTNRYDLFKNKYAKYHKNLLLPSISLEFKDQNHVVISSVISGVNYNDSIHFDSFLNILFDFSKKYVKIMVREVKFMGFYVLSYGNKQQVEIIKQNFKGIDLNIIHKDQSSFNYENFLTTFNEVKPDALVIDDSLLDNNGSLTCLLSLLNVKLNNNIFIADYMAGSNNQLKLFKDVISNSAKTQGFDNLSKQEKLSPTKLHNLIEEKLDSFCFNRCHLGYHYLCSAIEICYEHNVFIKNLTNEIYEEIASIYNSTTSKIERNIRTAINYATSQKAYKRDNPMKIQKITNRNVIFYIANLIKRGYQTALNAS